MTVIVGIKTEDTIWMGADRIRTVGKAHHPSSTPKVWRKVDKYSNVWVFGTAGAAELHQTAQFLLPDFEENVAATNDVVGFLYQHLVIPLHDKMREVGQLTPPDKETGDGSRGSLLIGVLGRLFFADGFAVCEEDRPFHTIGLGQQCAFGALHIIEAEKLPFTPEEKITAAILAATAFTPVIGGGHDIVHT